MKKEIFRLKLIKYNYDLQSHNILQDTNIIYEQYKNKLYDIKET